MLVVRYKMNTMEKMPMILGRLTILLALFTVAEGNGCESQQIVEIGGRSILNCSFSEGFVGIMWYNSTNFEDDPPILVFQHSEKSGQGYASGEFDILPSGSLIINNVSIMHETVFVVSQIINFKDPVKWHYVKVITYVKPSATFAVIRECNGKQHCFLGSSKISSSLNCYVNNARPKIKLFWIEPFHEEDKNVTKEHSTDYNGLTFSSAATTEYLPSKKYFLSLLACSATDPLMLLREDISLVLIQNEAKFVGNMETLKLYFEVGTVANLPCPSGSGVNAVLWQMSRSLEDDRQALAYRMSVLHVDVIIPLSAAGVELQNDGDLIIRGIQPQHEGFFFCIVRSMRKESIRSYEVITQVTPSPSHPVVDECNHQQYCVIVVEHGDTLICRLLGIRPITHLEWIPSDQRYQSMLQNQTLQVIPNGDTSDVYVTVRLFLTQYIDDQTTVVCRTKGLNSDMWDMNAIVDLRFFQEGLVVDDSPTKNRAILWVIIVSAVVFIIIAIILTRASVKYRANRKTSTESQNVDNEEMAPLKVLEHPTEEKQVNDENKAANRKTSTKSQKTLEEDTEEMAPLKGLEHPTEEKQVNDENKADLNVGKLDLGSKESFTSDIAILGLKSFSSADQHNITLENGKRVPVSSTLEEIQIKTNNGKEFTQDQVIGLLSFAQQCQRLRKLSFIDCLLPLSLLVGSLSPITKLRDIQVSWTPTEHGFQLDSSRGKWVSNSKEATTLETKGQNSLRCLCSSSVDLRETGSKQLQMSTILLLQIASSHNIPISHLKLVWSFSGFDGEDIRLESGLSLSSLSSVEKISINQKGKGNTLSEEEVIGLINYGIKSPRFKQLRLHNCKLPSSIKPDIIPEESKSRNIKVISSSESSYLDLKSGQWRKPDDTHTITEMCSDSLIIHRDTSESVQRSVIELLVEASNHDIPIHKVNLVRSFSKIDEDGNIILSSGLSLPILKSIEIMYIQTRKRREMNKHEVNGILNYVQHSQRFKELDLSDCLVPSSIPVGPSLSTLKSRGVKVFWIPDYAKFHEQYKLDLGSGCWQKAGSW
ncbi:uncharacterized protein [Apostichopus japonicus]|uniref:uncharacterized protein n=1 Tax=Stichopus japonicus TaxID=307972 RepID=UPI003AB8BD88